MSVGAGRPIVIVPRPEPEASQLAKRLVDEGCAPIVSPVLETKREAHTPWATLAASQASIFTSPRAIAALAEDRLAEDRAATAANAPSRVPTLSNLRALCVGDATAAAAAALGFGDVVSARGDAADLLEIIQKEVDPAEGPLLFLRARDLSADVEKQLAQAGFTINSTVLYRTEPVQGLRSEAARAFVDNKVDAVLFLSTRTARLFGEALHRLGEWRYGRVLAVCISGKVAEAARRAGFQLCVAAEAPNVEATLAVLRESLRPPEGRTSRLS